MPRTTKPPQVDERAQRRAEIMHTVGVAMKSLSAKKSMAWDRENEATIAAGVGLDNVMADFVEGSASREAVKKSYRKYADAHIVEKGRDNG